MVSEGFMELSRADYKFVHDSVQESAYNLIPAEEKNQFHYRLGISIYNNTPAECITNDLIFLITDQINHGNPSLIPPMQLINVAGLNYAAAKISMSSSNFTAARFYLGAAINLLPDGHWSAHYDLSKNLFFLIGNAALAAGHMTEASDAVNVLICNGRCLGKLDCNWSGILASFSLQQQKLTHSEPRGQAGCLPYPCSLVARTEQAKAGILDMP